MFAVPSKLTPSIVRAVCNAVAVAAFPENALTHCVLKSVPSIFVRT